MEYMYGKIPKRQLKEIKKSIRSSIFFLLLCVDPNTSIDYEKIDINKSFENLFYKLDGFNTLLFYPEEILEIMSLLKTAQNIYNNPNFEFKIYRKLILDAGALVLKIKEV